MRASLWYHLLDPCLRTAFSAELCCNQVPLEVSALSIPIPLEGIQDRTTSNQIHSAANCTILYCTLSCTDYIREARFHLYSKHCSLAGEKKRFSLKKKKKMLNQILTTTMLLPGTLLGLTNVSPSLPIPGHIGVRLFPTW